MAGDQEERNEDTVLVVVLEIEELVVEHSEVGLDSFSGGHGHTSPPLHAEVGIVFLTIGGNKSTVSVLDDRHGTFSFGLFGDVEEVTLGSEGLGLDGGGHVGGTGNENIEVSVVGVCCDVLHKFFVNSVNISLDVRPLVRVVVVVEVTVSVQIVDKSTNLLILVKNRVELHTVSTIKQDWFLPGRVHNFVDSGQRTVVQALHHDVFIVQPSAVFTGLLVRILTGVKRDQVVLGVGRRFTKSQEGRNGRVTTLFNGSLVQFGNNGVSVSLDHFLGRSLSKESSESMVNGHKLEIFLEGGVVPHISELIVLEVEEDVLEDLGRIKVLLGHRLGNIVEGEVGESGSSLLGPVEELGGQSELGIGLVVTLVGSVSHGLSRQGVLQHGSVGPLVVGQGSEGAVLHNGS